MPFCSTPFRGRRSCRIHLCYILDLITEHCCISDYQYFVLAPNYTETPPLVETWIGGTDKEKEGCWVWSDGSPLVWTEWYPGQPDNYDSDEHCMSISDSDAKMNDLKCDEVTDPKSDGWICKKLGKNLGRAQYTKSLFGDVVLSDLTGLG